MKAGIFAAFVLLVVLFFSLMNKSTSGFRGEAIGGRTGGDAYSGAGTTLDPGMP
jgi:ABC-type uncharacterized transport system permease subunit